jgi:hypothetical protein
VEGERLVSVEGLVTSREIKQVSDVVERSTPFETEEPISTTGNISVRGAGDVTASATPGAMAPPVGE